MTNGDKMMTPPILDAIDKNDLTQVVAIIGDPSFDPDEMYSLPDISTRFYTAISYAARVDPNEYNSDRLTIIQELIDGGGSISIGAPLLECRVLPIAELLVSEGADVNSVDQDFEDGTPTPLVMRCRDFNFDLIKYLLSQFAEVNVEDAVGNPLTHQVLQRFFDNKVGGPALDKPSAKLIDVLFDAGADIYATNSQKLPLLVYLFLAATSKNFDPVYCRSALVSAGCDVTEKGPNASSVIQIALYASVFRGKPFDAITQLLSFGGDITLTDFDQDGNTALHHACQGARKNFFSIGDDDSSLVDILIVRGSDVDAKNNELDTPLLSIVKRLSRDPETLSPYPTPDKGKNGRDAYLAVVESLCKAGADVTIKDRNGSTSLDYANKKYTFKKADGTIYSGRPGSDVHSILRKYDARLIWLSTQNVSGEEDPKSQELRASAKKLYDDANSDYRNMEGKKEEHIRINEAFRDTRTQAEYYDNYIKYKYFNGPKANLAAIPGQSRHEFGIAMDILRKLDEDRYNKALTDNGWEKTVPGEPWHFEATGASDFEEIEAARVAIKPKANDYAKIVYDVFALEVAESEERIEFQKKQRERQAANQEFRRARKREQAKSQELKANRSETSKKKRELAKIKADRSEAEKRLKNLKYDGCPNGYGYNDCDHEQFKQEYDSKKRNLESTIIRMKQQEKATQADISDLQREEREIRKEITALKRETKKAQDALRKAEKDEESSRRELRQIRTNLASKRVDKKGTLDEIVKMVKAA